MQLPNKERPFSLKDTGDNKKNIANVGLAIEQLWNRLDRLDKSDKAEIVNIYKQIQMLYNNTNFITSISGNLHSPATVADTTSIDMSISGQLISAETIGLTDTITFVE